MALPSAGQKIMRALGWKDAPNLSSGGVATLIHKKIKNEISPKPDLPELSDVPAPTPGGVPTIDQAAQRDDLYRRLARRKGHRANMRPGANAQASVAVKALLG